MRSFGRRQLAIVAALVALAFSAGLAQSGFARVTDLPVTFGSAAGTFEDELSASAHRGPFGGGDLLAAAADHIGISKEDLRTALQSGKSLADIAAENGKTRDGLIAALSAAATEKIGEFVDQKGPFGPGPGRGPGPGAPGKHFRAGVALVQVASDYLGIAREDLVERVRAGETLAQIANATAGKSREALVAAIVAASNAKIDEALTNGRVTQEQATKLRERQQEMAERVVDADPPFHKRGERKPGSP